MLNIFFYTDQTFSSYFFLYIKNANWLLPKKGIKSCQDLSEEQKTEKQKYGLEQFSNPSEAERDKTYQYGCELDRNLSEDKKQSLVEHRKNYSRIQKLIKTS